MHLQELFVNFSTFITYELNTSKALVLERLSVTERTSITVFPEGRLRKSIVVGTLLGRIHLTRKSIYLSLRYIYKSHISTTEKAPLSNVSHRVDAAWTISTFIESEVFI